MVCRQNLYHRIPRKLTPIVYYDYYQNDEYDDNKRQEKKNRQRRKCVEKSM